MGHYLSIMVRTFCVLMIGVLVLLQAPKRGSAQECAAGNPECWNWAPLVGEGPASNLNCPTCTPPTGDGSNRRVITVRIDPSWNTGSPPATNAAIKNATICAVNMWNNARDGQSANGYFFTVDQEAYVSYSPEISIVRQDITGGTVNLAKTIPTTDTSGTTLLSAEVQLDPDNLTFAGDYNEEDLCARVAHEFGHIIGLNGLTSTCTSIMRSSKPGGDRYPDSNSVSAADVRASNQNLNDATRGTCHTPRNLSDEPCSSAVMRRRTDAPSVSTAIWTLLPFRRLAPS